MGSSVVVEKFFESYFSFSYPYSRYAQTTVKEFEYGGMENTTCTTLDDIYISTVNSSRSIIAHELAHQWFGDLVTCTDWSDIWLNEGFATYCEALYIEYAGSDRKEEFYRYMEILAHNY
jgi:aminopeptidase N